jgi:hypothetical protein
VPGDIEVMTGAAEAATLNVASRQNKIHPGARRESRIITTSHFCKSLSKLFQRPGGAATSHLKGGMAI